ncbi:MAG: hypothetical protein A3C06_02620 [Candidatus Taylorbacteria bacterium RIFCSPHIGHO2_02_FULL_46_13]|uniref:Uncharacterized protein n=1 Tax=Candidatus Taylorbacteria bacterium RIFCSPHIGHO2_02_FULL_46_13 TaxID=1802312 RepID=A0A1G2MT86_9BACT|nr:MAG: hypothetical protein A3C06_02620 [Candidatus Taylorbacteria bacterium RIFCSPHIGHO2_02_FULL_46_13]
MKKDPTVLDIKPVPVDMANLFNVKSKGKVFTKEFLGLVITLVIALLVVLVFGQKYAEAQAEKKADAFYGIVPSHRGK